ncbi:glycerol-3-phosphate dehydrogenase, partial [Moraxella catarrhalis 12P80B1]
MKLRKPNVKNQKVQKIVDAASVGIDDAVSAIKESGLPNKPLISSIAELTGLKKKKSAQLVESMQATEQIASDIHQMSFAF